MNLRGLVRNAFAAMIQVVVSAALLLELYRFLMRHLGPEQIGVWSLVAASVAVARLGELGLGSGVTRFVAADLGEGNGKRAAATVGMSLAASGLVIGVVCILLMPVLDAGLARVITQPDLLASAHVLLPWALATLWLGSISQIILAALEASQRSDLKSGIVVCAAATQLGAAYLLVPSFGLEGLGPVQLIQSGVATLLAIGLLLANMRCPLKSWFAWDRGRFVKIIGYSGGVQLGAVGQLLFEPAVKLLLSIFGGLSLTGYYEIANRAVLQLRGIIVAAYQTLVPYVAHRTGTRSLDPADIAHAYRDAQGLLVVLAIPYFALFAAALPTILTLWRDGFDAHFVVIGLMCAAGWALNTLAVPSYLLYLAVGRVRWTVLTQIAIGGLNIMLAGAAGWLFGGYGVVAGAMLALALGSAITPIAFHREFGVSWREAFPKGVAPLAAVGVLGAIVLVAVQLHSGAELRLTPEFVAALSAVALACGVLVWRQPVVINTLQRLRAPRVRV